jgi:hypothetical protein
LGVARRVVLGRRAVDDGWRLRLAGLAREIDAGFAADALTPRLAELRAALMERLCTPDATAAGATRAACSG